MGIAILLSAISISLVGCSTTDGLTRAADQQGRIAAGIGIGPQPAECWINTPHAAVHLGDDAVAVIKRERSQTDKANASKHRCAVANETLHKALETGK